MARSESSSSDRSGSPWFTTTHWSVVLTAGHGSGERKAEALERLCRTYWRPLYFYARRRGYRVEDAEDLTQSFFIAFLETNAIERADQARGRFRTFLLSCLQNFLAKEWRKANSVKRGGGQTLLPLDARAAETEYLSRHLEMLNPEKVYEKSWALATLEEALVNLHNEYEKLGKGKLFERLRSLLWDEPYVGTYAELGRSLEMSEAAVKMAVARMRQRARELLRHQIANTVAGPEEVESEFRHLLAMLRA